ncbi:MAG: hypothetical protein D6826_07545 [Alphaproteobacteria bacterium]|nr:MAG: hypothetical protein D6826_07545 [Alphaproteobacteria bacterium]
MKVGRNRTAWRRRGLASACVAFRWLAVILAALLVADPAAAESGQRVPVEQSTTQQKARFIENLVTDSVSARTIEASDDDAAHAALKRARALVTEAKSDLGAGRTETANDKLDEALNLVNTHARRLSQNDVKRERLEEAYARRLDSVRTFLAAYERVAEAKDASSAITAQVSDIRAMVEAAEMQAGEGRYDEAITVLDHAYRIARGDIRALREGETLTRSLNFATAEEEYRYEHDRNDSYFLLLQFSINEKSPPKSRRVRIDALREEAETLRRRAETLALAGDYETAIGTILKSTETLLKAIRMSGVWIPG